MLGDKYLLQKITPSMPWRMKQASPFLKCQLLLNVYTCLQGLHTAGRKIFTATLPQNMQLSVWLAAWEAMRRSRKQESRFFKASFTFFPPFFTFLSGSVHLSLFRGHCNHKRPGWGEEEQDHAGEELRHPHCGGGLWGLHAVGRKLWKWRCCHCLQGDFSAFISFSLSTIRALRQWSTMTSAFLLFIAWLSLQWH